MRVGFRAVGERAGGRVVRCGSGGALGGAVSRAASRTARWCALRAGAGLLAGLLLAACGGGGDSGAPPAGPLPGVLPGIPSSALPRIEPYERSAVMLQASVVPRVQAMAPQSSAWTSVAPLPAAPLVALGPIDAASAMPESPESPSGSKAVAIGRQRQVDALRDGDETMRLLDWQATDGGGAVAAIRLRSEGAAGVRVGLQVLSLPPQARVSVRGQGSFEPVDGAQILATLERNARATTTPGKASAARQPATDASGRDDPRLYWLPAVAGPQVWLQIELPAGVDPASVRVAVPHLAHLWWTHAAARAGVTPKIGESGSCNADAACSPEFDAQARSVARMEFMRGGFAYLCTGTLMADVAASGLPYFLTAQHCIGDQAAASSLSTYWFYRASACNSASLDAAATQVHGGAALLHASVANDTSLLRLLQSPPARAVHAGSLLAPLERGATLAGLHHPGGDLLKLSVGTLEAFARCDQTQCEAVTGDGDFLSLRWRTGTTESGSSGSPVFATLGARRYVTGHLFAGTASCRQPDATDFYGRFDKAYPALRPWLGAVPGAPG